MQKETEKPIRIFKKKSPVAKRIRTENKLSDVPIYVQRTLRRAREVDPDENYKEVQQDKCYQDLVKEMQDTRKERIPTPEELAEAWAMVENVYWKWVQMDDIRTTHESRLKQLEAQLKIRENLLRRRAWYRKVKKIRKSLGPRFLNLDHPEWEEKQNPGEMPEEQSEQPTEEASGQAPAE